MLKGQSIIQIAYVVDDVRKAVERHRALYGSGPFFLQSHYRLDLKYRGNDVEFVHSAAFGQWGDVQVELMQQHDDLPSIINETHPLGSGRYGLHHVAMMTDDMDQTIEDLAAQGHSVAMDANMPEMNMRTIMADALATHGHFLEVYTRTPLIENFYRNVAEAAKGFDGKDLIRPMSDAFG